MDSSANKLPHRMLRQGRAPDPCFDPNELLFRRCKRDQVSDAGKLYPAAIGYQNWSVNRAKYSEPEDVLLPNWPAWGIAEFLVSDRPVSLKAVAGSNVFDFKPEHAPLDLNYAHTEVVTFRNGQRANNLDPPTEVKKRYRQILSDRSRILKTPGD